MGRAKWSKRGICRRASIGLTNVGGAVRLKMIPCAERAQDEDMELSFRIRIDSSALLHRYRLCSQRRHRTNGKHDERCVSCETPSVTFQTLDGRSVGLAQYRGKVVLLNFWGTWCGVCRSEIPELIKLQKEYGKRGFTVLGIAMEDKKSDVVSYVAKPQFDIDGQQVPMNYPVMLGGDEVAAKFGGFLGYPDSFVISKDGEVVEKIMGAIDADSASQLIRRLLRREGES